jgi:hypothetical protein
MDDVQKHKICTNVPSSETLRSYNNTGRCGVLWSMLSLYNEDQLDKPIIWRSEAAVSTVSSNT